MSHDQSKKKCKTVNIHVTCVQNKPNLSKKKF